MKYPQDTPKLTASTESSKIEAVSATATTNTTNNDQRMKNFVYPLNNPWLQTHRYDPKDLEPVLLSRQGNSIIQDDSMDLTVIEPDTYIDTYADTYVSPNSSIFLKEPTFENFQKSSTRQFDFKRSASPSLYSQESNYNDEKDRQSTKDEKYSKDETDTIKCNHGKTSSSSASSVKTAKTTHSRAGSIFPRTPPLSHHTSKMFTSDPAPPLPTHCLPKEISEMTLCSHVFNHQPNASCSSHPHSAACGGAGHHTANNSYIPHNIDTSTNSLNTKLFKEYKTFLQFYFWSGFVFFPCWIFGAGFARFRVIPLINEIEGDRFLFGTGSPNFHQQVLEKNKGFWNSLTGRDKLRYWAVLVQLFGCIGLLAVVALPTLLIVFFVAI